MILSTLSTSPVRALSLICKEELWKIRPSPLTISPASIWTISPIVNSVDSISWICPSRTTLTLGTDSFLNCPMIFQL